MFSSRTKPILVSYALIALSLLIVAIVLILNASGDVNPFSRKLFLRVHLNDASGLRKGSEVRLAGVPVGKVNRLTVLPPSNAPATPKVEALLAINNTIDGHPASELIRTDSAVEEGLADVVSLERLINITPGTGLGAPTHDYSMLIASQSSSISDLATGDSRSETERLRSDLKKAKQEIDDISQQLVDERQSGTGKRNRENTPRPASTQSTPAASPDYAAILNNFRPGVILFDPSSRMTVGKSERVVVRISKAASEELLGGLSTRTEAQVEVIKRVGPTMKVRLQGDTFTIDPIDPEEQVVTDSDVTQWSWDVVPTSSGSHNLLIVVTIVLGDKVKDIPAYEKAIAVSVDPFYSGKVFVAANWQYLVSTIIGSGLLGLVVAWRKRRKPGRTSKTKSDHEHKDAEEKPERSDPADGP